MATDGRSTPVCEHKNQMWNIQFTHGHCKDCGAEFGVVQSEREPTDMRPASQFTAMAWGDRIADEQLDELLARAEKFQTVLLRIDQFRDLVRQAKSATPSAGERTFAVTQEPVAWIMKNEDLRDIVISESDLRRQPEWVRKLWANATPLYSTIQSATERSDG